MSDTEDIQETGSPAGEGDDDLHLEGVRVADLVDGFGFWTAPQVGGEQRMLIRPDDPLYNETNEFIASTGKEGRDGDIIEQSSWRLGAYRQTRTVLNGHNPDQDVGRAIRVRYMPDVDQLRAAIQWDMDDPEGARIAGKHARGMRSAVSVGWRSGKRTLRSELAKDHPAFQRPRSRSGRFGEFKHSGYFLQRCTLLEISSVTVPADPRALQIRSASRSSVLEQVPDEGLRRELLACFRELGGDDCPADDPFLAAMRRVVLDCIRSDDEIRRAIFAHSLPAQKPTNPRPASLAHLFPGAT